MRIRVDDFHRPAVERHARGEGPETYYRDTFDLPALRRALDDVDAETVAVVDGIFLLRAELADIWTLSVFLECDRAGALERAVARDADPASRADLVVEHTDPDLPRLTG